MNFTFYFENADRRVIIDRKKKTDFDIIRGIYNTSHADKNDDTIVFNFDELLVNMVDIEKLYDKIVNIWDEHRRVRDNSKNSKIVFINDIKKKIP